MSDFQDPMDPWGAMGGLPGDALGPLGEPLQDTSAPLDSGLLALSPNNAVAGVSYCLPQEQLEPPLAFETQLAPLIEAADLGTPDSLANAEKDGGAGLVVASDVAEVESPEDTGGVAKLSEGLDTGLGEPSFSLEEIAEGLRIDYSPPPDVRISVSSDETPRIAASVPLQDEAWFADLRDSNRFRPGSEPLAPERLGQAYHVSRMGTGGRPRVRGRAFNPFRGRAQKCAVCGEPLTQRHCTNPRCPENPSQRCPECDQEVCQCS